MVKTIPWNLLTDAEEISLKLMEIEYIWHHTFGLGVSLFGESIFPSSPCGELWPLRPPRARARRSALWRYQCQDALKKTLHKLQKVMLKRFQAMIFTYFRWTNIWIFQVSTWQGELSEWFFWTAGNSMAVATMEKKCCKMQCFRPQLLALCEKLVHSGQEVGDVEQLSGGFLCNFGSCMVRGLWIKCVGAVLASAWCPGLVQRAKVRSRDEFSRFRKPAFHEQLESWLNHVESSSSKN